MSLRKQTFHILPFLNHIFEGFTEQALKLNITFSVRFGDGISLNGLFGEAHALMNALITADKVLLNRVVSSIIEYAFMSAGAGGRVTVKVLSSSPDETVRVLNIKVEDSGVRTPMVKCFDRHIS